MPLRTPPPNDKADEGEDSTPPTTQVGPNQAVIVGPLRVDTANPDLVDVQVPAGKVPEAGVLAGPDPVLDPGVRTMPSLEEGELAAGVLVVKA